MCADGGGKQLIGDVREPLPVRPKNPAKENYEYGRNGTANLFMAFEPLTGARRVEVTERKTRADFARLLKRIADDWYPAVERVTLVVDNLSTHKPAVLSEVFAPEEARRIMARLEFVYTPKNGSGAGGGGLGADPERRGGGGRLAVHDRRRADQAQTALPGP